MGAAGPAVDCGVPAGLNVAGAAGAGAAVGNVPGGPSGTEAGLVSP